MTSDKEKRINDAVNNNDAEALAAELEGTTEHFRKALASSADAQKTLNEALAKVRKAQNEIDRRKKRGR